MRAAAVAGSLLLAWASLATGGEPAPLVGSHKDLGCADCHQGEELLDCDRCHDAAAVNIHPVGMRPSTPLPEEFRLGAGGELRCRSCHRLHGGLRERGYLNVAGLPPDAGRAAFCARCHGEKLSRADPHKARQGTARCAFCHASIPEGAGAATMRMDIVKLCDFCHDALAKDHPRNIDPTLDLPKGLPLAPGGSWTCVTCHNPHGTTTTTHYVRTEFARHFERGMEQNPHRDEYSACKGCHTTSISTEIRPPDYRLRYKGDVNVLCVSCHVTDRGHHPTGLPPPPFMLADMERSPNKIPLDRDGRITCLTCHDNHCASGSQHMGERFYDRVNLRNDLCWICHRRDEFSRVTPHVDDPKMCVRCHESAPIPGADAGLMTIPKMVCLQCHEVKPHPANADHLRVPSERIHPDESLPVGRGGEVTCPTCHDPHGREDSLPRRLRVEASQICGSCHWR